MSFQAVERVSRTKAQNAKMDMVGDENSIADVFLYANAIYG